MPLVLSGCNGFRAALGLQKDVPNEFDIVNNAPLAVPPDFNLRPPQPGAPPSQRVSSTVEAKETIFRAGGGTGPLPSTDDQLTTGERDLLVQAGAQKTPPNIRRLVNQEADSTHPFGNGFVDRLIFWRHPKANDKGVLNPVKEEARLRREKAAQTTVSTQFSSQPTIEQKSESGGFFSHLF
ncbi:MAG: DUF3035 domain-containing protein [Stellaceae bacterium]